jgi:molecular chaperone GrpE
MKNIEENENLDERDLSEDIDKDENKNENKKMQELLKFKDEELSKVNNDFLRLQADFDNFRKRTEKEKENTMNYAIEYFVSDLLPTLDNFQRAMDSEEEKDNSFYKGVEMIYNELIKKLGDNGVEEIECVGKDFNPNFHHAILMEENDEYEEGKVIEVLQKGYTLKDKVIRPSMVKVAK